MLAVVHSFWVHGIEGRPVKVEANVRTGLPVFTVVGLPAGAVREGKERVFAALAVVGRPIPPRRITVNLAPADLPKSGSGLDLPIAISLLLASGGLPPDAGEGTAFVGELGLDGSVRPVRGAIALAMGARESGRPRLVVPLANLREASAVPGVDVLGVETLDELVDHLAHQKPLRRPSGSVSPSTSTPRHDLADVQGQEHGKRALAVAAAGGHSLLFTGPPGAGKTMLARRLPGLLPPLSEAESLDVTRIHSVAGLLKPDEATRAERPFRSPHHTISAGGLIGGGSPPRPGEISLAHHGVLFLDEIPEFRRSVLETLRQPMEMGVVRISRVRHAVTFPARFQVVAAMNPCPCGLAGDDCVCGPPDIRRYRARLSGPLLDRLDMQVAVTAVSWDELNGQRTAGLTTADARVLIAGARSRQDERGGLNAHLAPDVVMSRCQPDRAGSALMALGVSRLGLSARGVHRILRVARTIADMDGTDVIGEGAVAEALLLRGVGVGPPGRQAPAGTSGSSGA